MKAVLAGITLVALVFGAAPAWAQNVSWDWQLSEPFDLRRDVAVMDTDPDAASIADIRWLKRHDVMTICYVSVGTVEDYRSDASMFPTSVVGNTYGDWPDEKFLDIRAQGAILPLMAKRFRKCKAMGFDAIEPDNLDVHINDSGFDISEDDVVAYVSALADLAHGMGMQIGQKNMSNLTPRLVDMLDFAITEGCYQDGWCSDMQPYLDANKMVLDAEYSDQPINWAEACEYAEESGISMILKDRDLTANLQTCP